MDGVGFGWAVGVMGQGRYKEWAWWMVCGLGFGFGFWFINKQWGPVGFVEISHKDQFVIYRK